MTLSIRQLRERVTSQHGFSGVEQIGDSIIRAVRESGNSPFAVYYFDIGQELPQTQEKLTSYQDRVIGSRYFESRKSLQWSNYLYFLTTADRWKSSAVKEAKELIELDRIYARKFVILEAEIDSVLNPPVVGPSTDIPHANILSIWSDLLVEKNLDRAILSDDDVPARLSLIEHPIPQPSSISRNLPQSPEVQRAPSINSLYLKEFRQFPIQRRFNFGRVNLIFGPNGSGKTSLLEAIELFYCGRNKRNPSSQLAYELVAGLPGEISETATDGRSIQRFRDRNLSWYGQPEVKTNRLYLSFAQFNFLDTDAAVSLSDSTERLEEDLSNLLIGPDAAKTWHDIERVSEGLSSKLRELQPLEQQITDELMALENQLQSKSMIPYESESIQSRLNEILIRLGWTNNLDAARSEGGLVGSLSELSSVAQQTSGLEWMDAPLSLESLAKYSHSTKQIIENGEADIAQLVEVLDRQTRIAGVRRNDLAAKDIAEEASVLVERGIPKRIFERKKEQEQLDTYSELLTGFDGEDLNIALSGFVDVTVQSAYETSVRNYSVAQSALRQAEQELTEFVRLRDEATSLGQQLRQIASRILDATSKTDECPLCHTIFPAGELQNHISQGLDEHIEARGHALLTERQEKEEALHSARSLVVASEWLKAFAERAGLSPDTSVPSALSKAKVMKQLELEFLSRFEALDTELRTLESKGLSGMDLEEITVRLEQFGYPLAGFSRGAVQKVLSSIDQTLAESSKIIESDRQQARELEIALKERLRSAGLNVEHTDVHFFKRSLSRLKEQLTSTDLLRQKLLTFLPSFPWPNEKPLAELVVETESAKAVAAEYQAALRRETDAQAALVESSKRKQQLESQLNDLTPRIQRFAKAREDLDELKRNHSLSEAMKNALDENKASIELIFSRIHSPAEFRGLGTTWTTLIRKLDGRKAELSEISTGQRAAFALSIFLAQNAQLTKAPPVILIDDPIAHIDDLNCLSFLDYLREIVLTGRRQIFFATANEKLGTLFERKFDFLGQKDFQRFDLAPHSLRSA